MATYGPRPSDTVDFAQVKKPEDAKEAPWTAEEDSPRSFRSFTPPSGLLLGMEIILLIIVVGSVVAYLLGWARR